MFSLRLSRKRIGLLAGLSSHDPYEAAKELIQNHETSN